MNPASDLGWPQGFVVYREADLKARQLVVGVFTHYLSGALTSLNRAVRFLQIETPMLTPRPLLAGHEATGFDLVRAGFAKHGHADMLLRPETTAGTYAAFRAIWPMEPERKKQMPIVLWQFGKSFRDEQARPMAELRFREFYQLEYQLFFSPETKADYFGACVTATVEATSRLCGGGSVRPVSVFGAELAHYAESTTDIMVGEIEVAAISLRKDFEGARVVEVSVGLDRLTALQRIIA